MKRLILLGMLLLMAVPASANDISVIYADTITAADTGDVRVDTVWSPWVRMPQDRRAASRFFNFAVEIAARGNDTNWVDDTMWVKLQMAFDASDTTIGATPLTTFEVDTLLDVGEAIQEDILDADATVLPSWGRLLFIHFDSIGVGEADSALTANAVYTKTITLWYNIR